LIGLGIGTKSAFSSGSQGIRGGLARLSLALAHPEEESLAELPALRMLSLGHISKKQKLGFVSKIRSLRRLVIILGGREDISEIQHDSLEELQLNRGVNNGFTEPKVLLPSAVVQLCVALSGSPAA
jgi:hypothetical protein